MKTIKVNRNSWHYKVAKFGAARNVSDICALTNAFIKGLLLHILQCSFAVAMGLSFGDTIAWVASGLMWAGQEPSWMAIPFLFMVAFMILLGIAAGMAGVIIFINEKIYEHRYLNEEKGPKSIFSEMYDAWKSKYCVPIELE